jgi:hypothetical protein
MRIAAALAILLTPALSQKPPDGRSLDQLLAAFAQQMDQLYKDGASPTREQETDLRSRQRKELEEFVQHEARGDDRWRARTLLAEMQAQTRQRDRAVATIRALDVDGTPFPGAVRGAEIAERCGEPTLRDALVSRAKAAAKTPEERMDLARAMMTTLQLVRDGEAIADAEIAAAKDDEQRAYVRWLRCKAEREREDLPENAFHDALEKLASELPATRWGSVAKDRCAASQFTVGSQCFPFVAKAIDGAGFRSDALRGKAVALVFCDTAEPSAAATLKATITAKERDRDGLVVLVVAADVDCKSAARSATSLGDKAVVVCEGRGLESELALRFGVEAQPTVILLDRQGKIAGLNLHCETKSALQEFDEAMARALAK